MKHEPDLESAVVARTRTSYVDGARGRLGYAGIPVEELAEHSTFEETCFLLWNRRLPTASELTELQQELAARRGLPEALPTLLREMPATAEPMAALRTAVGYSGLFEASRFGPVAGSARAVEAARSDGLRLTARMPTLVAALARARGGQGLPVADPDLGAAGHFLHLLHGRRPDAEDVRVLERCWILHMDHGMNASTFALRVTAATWAGLEAAVAAALSTLQGPLHGGACEAVMRMLEEIREPAEARAHVRRRLEAGLRIMGFGHRVYRVLDPRARVLRELSAEAAARSGEPRWFQISREIEEAMAEVRAERGRPLHPNVDFYAASTYAALGIPRELFTPLFAVARTPGWVAHFVEQLEGNRLIRPRALYVGPQAQRWVPLEGRTTVAPADGGPEELES